MKAVLLKEFGGPEQLSYEEVSDPSPGLGEVLIRVKMAALNRRDASITYGQHYRNIKLPVIPGADGAGVVVELGEGVESVRVGAEVVINPALNWGENPRLQGRAFSILGVPTNGTYAQLVKVSAENVFAKPEDLSWEEAAAVPLAGLTAYRAFITRGQIQQGETVVIPGAGGGVATFLILFASALGARVFVTSSSDDKIARAKQLGAAGGVNYTNKNWVNELHRMTGGADLCVDSIGGDQFQALVSIAKPGSRIVSFGATRGTVPNLGMTEAIVKQLDIRGTYMGSPEEFEQMLELIKKYKIHPAIDEKFMLKDAVPALKRMESGQSFGKILLHISD